jgi:PAS domain S-box-containing protein
VTIMKAKTKKELLLEVEDLQIRLQEAEEILSAIRRGEVDGLVVASPEGDKVYTLRGASQVYRAFVESMSEGALSLTEEGAIFYSNAQFSRTVGIPMERLVGLPLKNLVAEADLQLFESIFVQGRESGARGELSLVISQGTLLPVQLSISPLSMKGDSIVACAIVTDLTEYKRKEKALAEEKLSRSILDQASEAVVVCDSKGKVIRVSMAAHDLCGESPLLKPFEEVFRLKSSLDGAAFDLSGPLQGEFVQALEAVLDRGGRLFHLLLNAGPLLTEDDDIIGCVITLTDISGPKLAQDALRKSEERYRTLFTSMMEGFALGEAVLDESGTPIDFRFIETNDAFEKETGLKRDIIGKPMTEVLPNLEKHWIETYGEVALTGKPVRFKSYNRDTDKHYDVYCYSPAKGRFAILFRDVTKEKQDEEALLKRSAELERARNEAENEKLRLQAVMEALPVGVAITDASGGLNQTNRAYEELWGGHHPETKSVKDYEAYKAWWPGTEQVVAPEEWAAAVAVQKGEAVKGQLFDVQRFDGTRAFVINSAAPVRDASGYVVGSAVVIQDITELQKAEQALRESEARFRILAESMPNFVWTCLPEGGCDYLSRQWLEYTGIPEAEQLGFGWLNQVHPDDRDRLLSEWRKVVERKEPLDAEFRIRRHDGEWRWFKTRAVAVRDEKGHITKWYGSNTDIEDLKRSERALRDSEARYKLLSETASRLLGTPDPQGVVNDLCRQVMQHLQCDVFFNFLADERAGKLHLNAFAGIPEEEAKKIEWLDYGVAVCGCVARDGERIVAEDIANTPDIRTDLVKSYGVQAYACHPLIAQGRLIGTLSFGTKTRSCFTEEDLALMKTVTDEVAVAMERVRLMEQLRISKNELEMRVLERTAELERRNQELQDFAFIASHDLQEPLRKVQTFGDMLVLKSDPLLGPEGRDYIQRMQRAAARMQKLLESLLSYSRVTTKAEPFAQTNLRKSVQGALSNLEIVIKEKGALVKVAPLPTVEADRSQMIQLFQNLIANALKFERENQTPRVSIYSRKHSNTGAHQICIEDNGIGFDEKYLDKIFMPFQRLHGRSGYEGVGMGLAICKKIVERHDGEITARSEPGKGATFIVTLPARRKKPLKRLE